ncbi:uncharacterized protein An12g02030 [Aspergillus niger]|uniref:Contig An12c0060, genomic contig n=2 Tax=Aspergillus niger TaxID=5061 RepID=A2QYQ0_ASPNC|nr:uncharacterized protein An12g02030 [Aspergillus niger]CAK48485.1 unnamed protein product [Aspergillus niger]
MNRRRRDKIQRGGSTRDSKTQWTGHAAMEPPWLALLLSIKLIGTVRGPPWRGSTVRSQTDPDIRSGCQLDGFLSGEQGTAASRRVTGSGRQKLAADLAVPQTIVSTNLSKVISDYEASGWVISQPQGPLHTSCRSTGPIVQGQTHRLCRRDADCREGPSSREDAGRKQENTSQPAVHHTGCSRKPHSDSCVRLAAAVHQKAVRDRPTRKFCRDELWFIASGRIRTDRSEKVGSARASRSEGTLLIGGWWRLLFSSPPWIPSTAGCIAIEPLLQFGPNWLASNSRPSQDYCKWVIEEGKQSNRAEIDQSVDHQLGIACKMEPLLMLAF